MSADVGVPLMTGVLDYGRGRYAEAVESLWSVRSAATDSAAAMRSADRSTRR